MNRLKTESVNEDQRRKLTQLLSASLSQVNLYECQAGQELGNHFHDKTIEYFYVLSGSMDIGNNFGSELLKAGDLYAVFPGDMHWIRTKEPTKFMTFLTIPFNPSKPDLRKS